MNIFLTYKGKHSNRWRSSLEPPDRYWKCCIVKDIECAVHYVAQQKMFQSTWSTARRSSHHIEGERWRSRRDLPTSWRSSRVCYSSLLRALPTDSQECLHLRHDASCASCQERVYRHQPELWLDIPIWLNRLSRKNLISIIRCTG